MDRKTLSLPYMGTLLELQIPASWNVAGVHRPAEMLAAPDIDAGLEAALAAPIGTPPWRISQGSASSSPSMT